MAMMMQDLYTPDPSSLYGGYGNGMYPGVPSAPNGAGPGPVINSAAAGVGSAFDNAPLMAWVILVAGLVFTRLAYELAQESPGQRG